LSYLRELPINAVKVDKSFVNNVVENHKDQALLKSILTFCQALELDVIVEGVETREQVDWLYQAGCRVFQGYYFAKPMNYKNFEAYIKAPWDGKKLQK